MPSDSASQRYKFVFVIILTLAVLAAFLTVIQKFLLDILLAAIFAGILQPLFRRVLRVCGGRRPLAASLVIAITLLAIALPLLGVLALVGSEAVQISKNMVSWAQQTVNEPSTLKSMVPDWLMPDRWLQSAIAMFKARIGDVIRLVSGFLSSSVSSVTQGAIALFLDLFVVFFGMFYFLHDGHKLIKGLIARIPLGREEARSLVEKTLLITTATLKSIVIVGLVQGALIGVAFAVIGLGQPWFWGAVVAVSSVVPALGAPIVYVPAAIYLMLSGQTGAGIGIAVWGMAVVGTVDNLLRIYIVGRGTALPDFLVFISTVGGLIVLGIPGLLVGPILAGLLIGVLDLYQRTLQSSGLSNDAPEPELSKG